MTLAGITREHSFGSKMRAVAFNWWYLRDLAWLYRNRKKMERNDRAAWSVLIDTSNRRRRPDELKVYIKDSN